MKTHRNALVFFLILVFLTGSVGVLIHKGFLNSIKEQASLEFSSGNYLASLASYNRLKEYDPHASLEGVQYKIEEASRFLVADANFASAKKAAEEGDWFAVKALLGGDPSVINTSFAHYEEAIDLFITASKKVGDLEVRIDKELKTLQGEALQEKGKRKEAEEKALKAEDKLEATIAEKEKKESELRTHITEVEKEKEAALKKAKEEQKAKFVNELLLYVGLLEKGNGFLDSALADIDALKDTSALSYVSKAKDQFTEVSTRGEKFLAERTRDEYKIYTQKLLQAAALLIDASRHVGSLVAYMDIKDGDEYKKFLLSSKDRRQTALALLNELHSFISTP